MPSRELIIIFLREFRTLLLVAGGLLAAFFAAAESSAKTRQDGRIKRFDQAEGFISTANNIDKVFFQNRSPSLSQKIFKQSAKLAADSGGPSDAFGSSVAISGDTAVIGAPGTDLEHEPDRGMVHVFVRSGGQWVLQAKLTASDGVRRDGYGVSVAISGDLIIVGANSAPVDGRPQGKAYIYVRSGQTWTEVQKIVGSDGDRNDNFGSGIGISGDTIAIGAPGHMIGDNDFQGAVYVFRRESKVWTPQAKLTVPDGGRNDALGSQVAIEGDTLVAGAQNNLNRGAVYVFVRSGTSWTQKQKIVGGDTESGDEFGAAVDICGETIVVGAEYDTVGTNPSQGSAYIFVPGGGIWAEQAKLTASDGIAYGFFGLNVSISKDTAVIGALYNQLHEIPGAAYVFVRNGTTWMQADKLTSENGPLRDGFGRDVAIDGEKIVAGAPAAHVNGNPFQGAAYIFSRAETGGTVFDFDGDRKTDLSVFRPSTGEWLIQRSSDGQVVRTQFGRRLDEIAPADYDGDARTDIAVFRPSDGIWWILRSSDNSYYAVQFGQNGDVPRPGDFDGDGRADISVFRPSDGTWYRINSSDQQFVAVRFGLDGDAPLIADFDGDSKSDIAVWRRSDGVWYWLNSSNGQFSAVRFGMDGDIPTVGDFDSDGRSDISVFRFSNATWHRLNSSDGQYFGLQFGSDSDTPPVGDYDGDGKSDIAVWRSLNLVWYLLLSNSGETAARQFGRHDDRIVPTAYLSLCRILICAAQP